MIISAKVVLALMFCSYFAWGEPSRPTIQCDRNVALIVFIFRGKADDCSKLQGLQIPSRPNTEMISQTR